MLKDHPAMDGGGVWSHLESVAASQNTVTFRFSRTFVPALQAIAHQPIVPRHVWSSIAKPVSFANETPVGTGPFTEVLTFQNQIYELGQNPYYWQKDTLGVTSLRMPAFPSNDQANLALVSGEVDWAGNFVPAIDRIYVEQDPEHHGYWFPLMGSTVFLYPNTARKPFDTPEVRKALSMAIDREMMVKVAMYTYTRPSDGTGMSQTYDAWRDPDVAARATWVDLDTEKANSLLDEAGLRLGSDGVRRAENGDRMHYELIVVSGWSDWVRAAQIVASSLQKVGVSVEVKTYDFGAWFSQLQKGEFDLAISWSVEGQTPYDFYRWLMSSKTRKPIGEVSPGNWHRFSEPRADKIFDAFEVTSNRPKQEALSRQLQALFEEKAPAIPLFPNPSWGVYNSVRFEGFPTQENPYAQLSPNKVPENLLVLTRLIPTASRVKAEEGRD
jgi:peptide/nickel transport system substrate-binding protein